MIESRLYNYVEIASFQEAKNNNAWCGDAFLCIETDEYFICAISDGLGSGQLAHNASQLVISYIKENHHEPLVFLMDRCNELLLNKRGVVLSIVKVDFINKEIIYSNTGNINCIFYTTNGILTRTIPKRGFLCGRKSSFTTQHIPYDKGMRFVLFTDGIELPTSLHNVIAKEVPISRVIDFVKERATLKEDDITFLVGDILD